MYYILGNVGTHKTNILLQIMQLNGNPTESTIDTVSDAHRRLKAIDTTKFSGSLYCEKYPNENYGAYLPCQDTCVYVSIYLDQCIGMRIKKDDAIMSMGSKDDILMYRSVG